MAAAFLVGCGSTDDSGEGDGRLDSLFAPPTAQMVAEVQKDWLARSLQAPDARVVLLDTLDLGAGGLLAVHVVRHGVAGAFHYGALLHRVGADSLPTLVYAHGGDNGVDLSEVQSVLQFAPDLAGYALVVPSFRAEPLALDDSVWLSQGQASPWDRDVDDLLQLVAALDSLQLPGKRDSLYGIGFSRGGGTIVLAAARDARFVRVVDFFGPADFLGDFVRDEFAAIQAGSPSDRPGVDALGDQVARPFLAGTLPLDEARMALLRRSPVYFASQLPPVQIHHGDADTVVPIAESQALWAAVQASSAQVAASAFYTYAGAGHNPLYMVPPFNPDNAIARTVEFLQGSPAVALAGIFPNDSVKQMLSHASWVHNAAQ